MAEFLAPARSFAIICILLNACAGQESASGHPESLRSDDALQAAISGGDPAAMREAALSKNRNMVPYLRKQLLNPDKHYGGPAATAQEALAKLGERDQIDTIVCELYNSKRSDPVRALQKLVWVGGYASVKALSNLLLDTPRNDVVANNLSMRHRAAIALQKLVPQLQVPLEVQFGVPPSEEQYRAWRNWLAEHRNELVNLQPSDGGDIAAEECLAPSKKAKVKVPRKQTTVHSQASPHSVGEKP